MNVRAAFLVAAAGALVALSTTASLGQATTPPPETKTEVRGTVEFAQDPFRLDSVGLTMFLPLGCTAESSSMPGKSTVCVKSGDVWIANIQTPRMNNDTLTAATVLEGLADQVLKKTGEVFERGRPDRPVGYRGKTIGKAETRIINNRRAEVAYLHLPGEGANVAMIRGFYVFQITTTQFVTFELITPEPSLAVAQREFEAMVATSVFEDPAKADADRATAIQTGIKVMERVPEATLREIVAANPENWERLFRPAPTGARSDDEEVGYRRVRTSIGRRGDLDPSRKKVGAGDRQQGYVVALDARFLDRTAKDLRIIDSQALYFMSFDRESESWNVSNAIRSGTSVDVFREIGGRHGPAMTVEVIPPKGAGRTVRPVIQGEGAGYISRVESMLLPQIMLRAGITADAGFHAYQSESETIRLRRDTLEQPIDRPGMWRVTTKLSDSVVPTVSVYNAKFDLIRTDLPRGVVAEPITLDDLKDLWQGKGLPMN